MISKFRKSNKGFTLVELLVSLSIIALAVVVFIELLNSSFMNIHTAGRKSAAMHIAKGTIENAIADVSITTGEAVSLRVTFPSGDIKVSGKKRQISYTYEGKTKNITIFLPGR